jgi:hypothetical protein
MSTMAERSTNMCHHIQLQDKGILAKKTIQMQQREKGRWFLPEPITEASHTHPEGMKAGS